jgi:predicted acylesterase/phospholipase RssA
VEYIEEAETAHDYVVFEADGDRTRWTRRSVTLADRIVVVMSSAPDHDELLRAEKIFTAGPRRARVERWLALVQSASTERPSGTAQWVDRLGADRVVHVREGGDADVRRLARLVSGNATALVLGGGGARGFAHLGVWQALEELGVPVDVIAGASIGAPLGAGMALQIPAREMTALAAGLFHGLLDYTVPVVSLIKGERVTRNIASQLGDLDILDLWLPFLCVSTNLTWSRVQVHDRGPLATAVRASVALPGILPPVPYDGDLLVDGGVLNNLPCDVVSATRMVATTIAVDLSPPVGPRAKDDFGLSVSGWKALRSRVVPGSSPYPGLMPVLMRSMITASVRDRDRVLAEGRVDCYLDLHLGGVNLLDFERVEEVAQRGYADARPRLEAWLEGR